MSGVRGRAIAKQLTEFGPTLAICRLRRRCRLDVAPIRPDLGHQRRRNDHSLGPLSERRRAAVSPAAQFWTWSRPIPAARPETMLLVSVGDFAHFWRLVGPAWSAASQAEDLGGLAAAPVPLCTFEDRGRRDQGHRRGTGRCARAAPGGVLRDLLCVGSELGVSSAWHPAEVDRGGGASQEQGTSGSLHQDGRPRIGQARISAVQLCYTIVPHLVLHWRYIGNALVLHCYIGATLVLDRYNARTAQVLHTYRTSTELVLHRHYPGQNWHRVCTTMVLRRYYTAAIAVKWYCIGIALAPLTGTMLARCLYDIGI